MGSQWLTQPSPGNFCPKHAARHCLHGLCSWEPKPWVTNHRKTLGEVVCRKRSTSAMCPWVKEQPEMTPLQENILSALQTGQTGSSQLSCFITSQRKLQFKGPLSSRQKEMPKALFIPQISGPSLNTTQCKHGLKMPVSSSSLTEIQSSKTVPSQERQQKRMMMKNLEVQRV